MLCIRYYLDDIVDFSLREFTYVTFEEKINNNTTNPTTSNNNTNNNNKDNIISSSLTTNKLNRFLYHLQFSYYWPFDDLISDNQVEHPSQLHTARNIIIMNQEGMKMFLQNTCEHFLSPLGFPRVEKNKTFTVST